LTLQNARHHRVATFLKAIWFTIAGVLVLAPAAGWAESYLRVAKNGVVYYYFADPASPKPGRAKILHPPAGKRPAKPAFPVAEALTQEPSLPQNPPLSLIKESIRGESQFIPGGSLPLMSLIPARADGLQAINPFAGKENFGASTRYLRRIFAKFGHPFPRTPAADNDGPHESVMPVKEPQALVQDRREDFLKFAKEKYAGGAQLKEGLAILLDGNPISYCFPVASPFSFRDSWGDYRSMGRHHRAVDIFAREGTAVYAITAGVIQTLATFSEAGLTLLMWGQDGRGYGYMHLQAYAPGMVQGKAVQAGELLGYVGRTGLQNSAAHLHFQFYADHRLGRDELLNPYPLLVQLCHGVGVTDLHSQHLASIEAPELRGGKIQVTRLRGSALKGRTRQVNTRDSSTLVIRNF